MNLYLIQTGMLAFIVVGRRGCLVVDMMHWAGGLVGHFKGRVPPRPLSLLSPSFLPRSTGAVLPPAHFLLAGKHTFESDCLTAANRRTDRPLHGALLSPLHPACSTLNYGLFPLFFSVSRSPRHVSTRAVAKFI